MSKRTAHALAAAAACAALLLTACGGEGDDAEGPDQIEGAGKTKDKDKDKSPSANASSGTEGKDPDAPRFDFPKGVEVVIEDEMTGDAKKDEVLRDHEYATKAMILTLAKGNADLPVANRYVQDTANENMRKGVKSFRNDGYVSTGTFRYYNRKVTVGEHAASITYCESQRDAFDKVVKTGKVIRTKPSAKDFSSFKDIMQERGGTWRLVTTNMKQGDPKCAR